MVHLASPVLALGGGGSGGFGGGGGGGGFGGLAGHGLIFGPAWLVVSFFLLRMLMSWYQREAMQRRRDGRPPISPGIVLSMLVLLLFWPLDMAREARARPRRVRRVALAAAEASDQDPMFDAELVRVQADALFREVQSAWSEDDRDRLAAAAGATLMTEWYHRLTDFSKRGWRNEVQVLGNVEIDYVGLTNRGDEREDQVCVRIAARVTDVVRDRRGALVRRRGSVRQAHRVCEYWTLGKRDGRWIVVRIEQHREGLHQLQEPIVASPWADDERLRREAVVEQAVAGRLSAGELAAVGRPEIDENARLAALDLSLVDGRFAPDVLATEAGYAVAAWAGAIDGDRSALTHMASPQALSELLYADDSAQQTRVVVRGLTVSEVRIVSLASDAVPARMTIELHASGIAYTEDRSTLIVVRGDRSRRRSFAQQWTLELTDATEHPWRIVGATAAVGA